MPSPWRRGLRSAAISTLVAMTALTIAMPTSATAPSAPPVAHPAVATRTPTPLGNGTALYPRLIRLAHSGRANGALIASVVSFDPQGYGAIYRSTDDGRTFTPIGAVRDPASARGFCCTSLYELPRRVGAFPAGTLVWAGSFGQDGGAGRRMSIDLWASRDHGVTWRKASVVRTAPNAGGLWEPEMRVDAAGRLQLFYSDETRQPTYSQALMQTTSHDGLTWSPSKPLVALADPAARPGMSVVRELVNGRRVMTYEICGPGYNCAVYLRTSRDGAHWGNPTTPGRKIVSTDHREFRHAPTITVVDDGSRTGRIVLVGQMLYDRRGRVDPGNGVTLMTNSHGGSGPWTRIAAPVPVPTAYDNYCPNYSSALAGTRHGRAILEIATGYVGPECHAAFGTGRLPR